MREALSMHAFRALDRPAQVLALEESEALGIGVFKHHVAHYYMYHDYYVALCSTKCGIDFTLVFQDGYSRWQMIGAINLKGLPQQVKAMTKRQTENAMLQEYIAEYRKAPKESMQEIQQRLHALNLPAQYELAKLQGQHMAFFRSLTMQERTVMYDPDAAIGRGTFQHYSAAYYLIDDFFFAACITTDGEDFPLVFRSGRAFADMQRALNGG